MGALFALPAAKVRAGEGALISFSLLVQCVGLAVFYYFYVGEAVFVKVLL